MKISILDTFVLSALDRGAKSPYELQRNWGLSVGASLPSLRRLSADKLVSTTATLGATNRPRHCYHLTEAGKRNIRLLRRKLLDQENARSDLDSVLRIVDMAVHYGAGNKQISEFLKHAAEERLVLAKWADAKGRGTSGVLDYPAMRARCDAKRLRAEAKALKELASPFKAPAAGDPRRH